MIREHDTPRRPGEGLAQHLLCAVPQLQDPNFVRAVVLVVDHSAEGAFGLILNSRLPTPVGEMASAIGLRWAGPAEQRVNVGGPVEPSRGFILHDAPAWDPLAEAVSPGVFLTTSLDGVRAAAGDDTPRLGGPGQRALAVLGYAGWGAGQLESEMAAGSWMAVPLRAHIDDAAGPNTAAGVDEAWLWSVSPEAMWAEALRAIGIDPARLVGAGLGSGKAPQA